MERKNGQKDKREAREKINGRIDYQNKQNDTKKTRTLGEGKEKNL